MSWTEDKVALLRQLWGSGKSASEIAELLGDVSRNAVIGKAHRLGLSGRPSPIKKRKRVDVKDAKPGGATILNLTDRMCRWPIGDPKQPGFRFCGKPSAANLPYCAEHAAIAYQVPGGKRREEDTKAVGT
jgi:GcrA cell cycle regulator